MRWRAGKAIFSNAGQSLSHLLKSNNRDYYNRVRPCNFASFSIGDYAEDDAETSLSHAGVSHAAPGSFILQPRVVIYDGVCHLCNAGINWVIRADKHKKIRFCAVQSKAAEPYLYACGLDREDVLKRFLFVEGPDSFYQASSAALKVMSYLPPPYCFLSGLTVIPSPLRDYVYDYVAKNRYEWFGKSSECIVPDSEVMERFIDREEIVERQRNMM